MYNFSIGIPFKSSQSTLNFEVPWSAVSILVSGVIDTVEYLREYKDIKQRGFNLWVKDPDGVV
jgi:hypothetical protein